MTLRVQVRIAAISLLMLWGLSACRTKTQAGGGENALEVHELRQFGSPGAVTFPELAADLGYLGDLKLKTVGTSFSGPQAIQTVVSGDIDFGSAFNGAVLKLFAAKAPIVALISSYGVDSSTWAGFYTLAEGPVRSARDLLGKKVAVNTVGAHQEFMLHEWLVRQGLSHEDAKQVVFVVVPPVNAEQALRQKQVDVAVIGGPMRDMAVDRGGLRLLFSDRDLYGDFNAGTYIMRKKFVEANPNTVRRFVGGVARAMEWTRTSPRDSVVARYKDILKRQGRDQDTVLLRYWRSPGIVSRGGLVSDLDFRIWIDGLVAHGELAEGQIAPAGLYTNAYNLYRDSTGTTESKVAEK